MRSAISLVYSLQSLFPHILSTLPNHHSIATTTTHHNPWYSNHKINQKQRKIKPKSIQTQNQTFNGKLNNLEPKIKFQQKTHQHKPKLKLKLLSPLHGELVAFFARGELAATIREEWNKCLRAKTKEKIQKKKWREKTMEVERRCDFVR